jgi:hypothetical protein
MLLAMLLAFSLPLLRAQELNLPRLSPKASVSYTIGMTEVKISYGAPAVKDRVIWGGVVPYGKVWRGGANEATTVEFSTDVNVEGQHLPKGKYALFFIPEEDEWTVIFNRKTDQWGSYEYDESADEIRIYVEPKLNEGLQERLTYSIHDLKMDMGYIRLAWEKLRLFVRFKTDAVDQGTASVLDALRKAPEEKKWAIYAQGAQFLLDADSNPALALEWAKASTESYDHSWNWYIRARAEAKMGNYQAAVSSGTKAAEFGLANPEDYYYKENKKEINSSIQSWAARLE